MFDNSKELSVQPGLRGLQSCSALSLYENAVLKKTGF